MYYSINGIKIKELKNRSAERSILFWLGMRDSNPRMLGPEPSALPLGESPTGDAILPYIDKKHKVWYNSNSGHDLVPSIFTRRKDG